jgi:TPR repeat protein
MVSLGFGLVVLCASAQESAETEERIRIAAANMEDALVVDCQLPGKLRRLGGTRNYLTPGRLIRESAIVCRTRGGEYTLGDLASGTLSLQRWMVPANEGDAEAQYYVARIYANGMDNVDINYAEAARWYQMAADQGFAEAKQELGYLYERGLGVPRDELKALNLQREASGLGEQLDYAYKIEKPSSDCESAPTPRLAPS